VVQLHKSAIFQLEATLLSTRIAAPGTIHLEGAIHHSAVENCMSPSVLFAKVETLCVSVVISVDIEDPDGILTCALNPAVVYIHIEIHWVPLPELLVESAPKTVLYRLGIHL